ncbi:hypothetical protein [Rhodopirellula baltica]|uniref:hypothetical protein n=1 Tax=Rhodopirellula baltica TaxID=265606 RepID=UPI0036F37176
MFSQFLAVQARSNRFTANEHARLRERRVLNCHHRRIECFGQVRRQAMKKVGLVT